MAFTLSLADLQALDAAQTALLSPLDHETPEAWADAVIGSVQTLVGAENVVVLVADAGERPLYRAEPFPDDDIHHCVETYGLTDLNRLWFTRLGGRTAVSGDLWAVEGASRAAYLRSETFNDFYRPRRIHASGYMAVDVERGKSGGALLHLSADRWDHPIDSDRTRALLRLLWPAFEASVRWLGRLGAHRASLLATLDGTGLAALATDADGHVVHETPALAALLAENPERAHVTGAMRRLATGRANLATADTMHERYVLRATHLDASGEAAWGRPLTLVAAERHSHTLPPTEALRARFGLTPQEARVARLLAERRTTREIADALGVSPKTAGRHTENVFDKLGVTRRTAVAAALTAPAC